MLKVKIKYLIYGFLIACLFGIGGMIGFSYFYENNRDMTVHEQTLPSGKSIRITMCDLLWGVEHNDRFSNQDCFAIEYVMSTADSSQEIQDREAMDVFELIRPVSEQWKIEKASLTAFPTLKRKGTYSVYALKRNPNGKWEYKRYTAKVHIND
jgi:hypothetical protein